MNIFPEPIATYFTGQHNPEVLEQCFTKQAVVKDEGHTYTGIPAIQAMLARHRPNTTLRRCRSLWPRRTARQAVRANVSGNFPGSPIVLSYRFRLEGS
jgi:hypothetical protein